MTRGFEIVSSTATTSRWKGIDDSIKSESNRSNSQIVLSHRVNGNGNHHLPSIVLGTSASLALAVVRFDERS